MRIREVMTQPVMTIAPDSTLRDAVRIMNEGHFRQLPVVDCGRLVGILTDRDIRLHVIHLDDRHEVGGTFNRALEIPVEGVMSRDVKTLRADLDVKAAVDAFISEKYGGFPVVDEAGRLVGILTYIDLLVAFRSKL